MSNKIKPYKWKGHMTSVLDWWNSLTIEKKKECKAFYEKIREETLSGKNTYPNMYDTTKLKCRELSEKQIERICVFTNSTQNPKYNIFK